MAVSALSARGGAHRSTVPEVCLADLQELLRKHIRREGVSHALHFAGYENIARGQAIQGYALAGNQNLLRDLLQLCPRAEIKASQLKKAVALCAHEFPGLGRTGWFHIVHVRSPCVFRPISTCVFW